MQFVKLICGVVIGSILVDVDGEFTIPFVFLFSIEFSIWLDTLILFCTDSSIYPSATVVDFHPP